MNLKMLGVAICIGGSMLGSGAGATAMRKQVQHTRATPQVPAPGTPTPASPPTKAEPPKPATPK